MRKRERESRGQIRFRLRVILWILIIFWMIRSGVVEPFTFDPVKKKINKNYEFRHVWLIENAIKIMNRLSFFIHHIDFHVSRKLSFSLPFLFLFSAFLTSLIVIIVVSLASFTSLIHSICRSIQWNECIRFALSYMPNAVCAQHIHLKEWKQQCLPEFSLFLLIRTNKNKSDVPIRCVELFKHVALSIVYYEYAIAINLIASKHCGIVCPSHLHVANTILQTSA